MKPRNLGKPSKAGGVQARESFGISQGDEAHIMGILRDTLYTDRILAVLREYGSNAWDEHRQSGQPNKPIKVVMPTLMAPTLKIRDFGRGLSEQEVLRQYTQYGASTKRSTNEVVGALGIGCLLAGQPIVTIDGMKAVEDIEVGDLVLTHKGRFMPVTDTMERHFEGTAFEVWLSQANNPLILTDEHPILISDQDGNTEWRKPGEVEGGYRSRKKGVRCWNSYAVLPATLESSTGHIHVIDHMNDSFQVVDGVLTRKVEFSYHDSRLGREVHNNRTTTWENFPTTLELDAELGWLLGMYAAEGSSSSKQVTFSLSSDEGDLADCIEEDLRDYFGVDPKRHMREERKLLEIVVNHTALAHLLSSLCGKGSANKQVPREIMTASTEVRAGFLRGVFDGDGSPTRQRFVFGVASPKLAWGVRTLMAVTEDKWGSVGTMDDYPGRWSIHYKRNARWGYSFREGELLLRPIKEVKPVQLDTTVYNFSVKEDESYVSDFVLHNCKSGFAYSDSFTVTSWHKGWKGIFSAVLDETGKGEMIKLHEEKCNGESGVEITIPVDPKDINAFNTRASDLFKHFDPLPDINLTLPVIDKKPTKSGYFSKDLHGWIGLMGCVPYRINLNQVYSELQEIGIAQALSKMGGVIFLDIGDVAVAASREELKYDEATKKVIVAKFKTIYQAYVRRALGVVRKKRISGWDKRIELRRIKTELGIGLPKNHEKWGRGSVLLWGYQEGKDKDGNALLKQAPKSFYLWKVDPYSSAKSKGTTRNSIKVEKNNHLALKDSTRPLLGYNAPTFGGERLFVVPTAKPRKGGWTDAQLKEVRRELNELLKEHDLEGIHIVKCSDLPWAHRQGVRIASPKHSTSTFRLKNPLNYKSTLSENWDIEKRTPTNEDVFMVLSRFEPVGQISYSTIQSDAYVAAMMGVKLPNIYGYKTTTKKPVNAADCQGTEYSVWRVEFFRSLMNAKWRSAVTTVLWSEVLEWHRMSSWAANSAKRRLRGRIDRLRLELGENHQVVQALIKNEKAFEEIRKKKLQADSLRRLRHIVTKRSGRMTPVRAMNKLKEDYPLLFSVGDGLLAFGLGTDTWLEWLGYVKVMDKVKEQP